MKLIKLVIKHVMDFLEHNRRANISALSGQSAFFILLSAVPFLMFIFAIAALFFGEPKLSEIPYRNVLSPSGAEFISKIVIDAYKRSNEIAVYTVIFALWSAGKGMYAVSDGILRIYRLDNNKPWLVKRIFAMGYIIVSLLLVLVSTAFMAVDSFLTEILGGLVSEIPFALEVVIGMRYIIIAALMIIMLTLALKLLLRRRVSDPRYAKIKALLPGAVFTAIGWTLLSFGVSIYNRYFTSSSIYGSLGAVVVIMMWVYFAVYILLCGVQINYIYRDFFISLFTRKKKKKQR